MRYFICYVIEPTNPDPHSSRNNSHLCLVGSGGLLGLLAAELGLGVGLDGLLGVAESADTLDGGLAEVAAVAALGGEVGNSLVGPEKAKSLAHSSLVGMLAWSMFDVTHFLAGVCWLKLVTLRASAGFWAFFSFLLTTWTAPFSPAWMLMDYEELELACCSRCS